MVHKVAVVGGGVIGMTTAVVIAENLKDVHVTVISDKWSPDTTGDGSAGFWAPYLLGDLPSETLKEWCEKSMEIFREIFQSDLSVEYGVGLLPVYRLNSTNKNENYAYNDLFLSSRPMTEKELSVFPSKFRYGTAMTSFFVECSKLLPALMKRVQKRGGRFIEKKVHNFSELADNYDAVINCAGLGARNLVPDPSLIPVRGQVIKVHAPFVKHCITLDGIYYIIPNSDVVILGGTAQKNDWNLEADPEDRRRIWENCTESMPCLKESRIIGDWVGLRPYRPIPRVDREAITTKKGKLEVIHNYGHGGSGVTLSWGCAYHALGLLREALGDTFSIEKQQASQYNRSKI